MGTAEQPGRDKGAFLEALVDAVGGVIWEFDWETGAFTYVSAAAERLLGYSQQEWLAPGFWVEHLHPDDAGWAPTYCVNATTACEDHEFTYRMIRADGTIVWIRDIVTVDKELGMAGRLRGMLLDVTREREATLEIERRAQEFAAVFRLMRDLYFHLDSDGVVTHFESASDDDLFVSPEMFVGKRLDEVLPPHVSEVLQRGLETVHRENSMTIAEYTLSVGGHDKEWEARFLPLEGGCTALVVREVTERKVRERELAESESRFRTLVESAPFGIHLYGLDGDDLILQGANPSAHRIVGMDYSGLVGLTVEEAFPGLAGTEVAETYKRLAREGGVWESEELTYDDGTIQGAYTVHAFQTTPGQLAVAFTDVTQRRIAEENERVYLHRLSAMAADLTATEDRERHRLAEELHDRVGQPLAVAAMRLNNLSDVGSEENAQEIALTTALLELAIHEVRLVTTELAPPVLYELGVGAALNWLCDELEKQYSIHITANCEADETGVADDAKMVLFRAARELAVNVVKHAKTDEMWIDLSNEPGWLVMTVEDRGCGFDGHFEQADSGESGFGLFSIRERVPHLGGVFEMESAPGEGTTVTVKVPAD